MLFERVAIIGIGLIGGSFALAARAAGVVGEVIGVARTERTLLEAMHLGAVDRISDDPAQSVRGADLVFIATPVAAIPALLGRIAPALPPGCIVTDAGSTKRMVMEAAQTLPAHADFVGGHPMAGSEQAGIAAARASLFRGHTWLLTPGRARPEAVARLRAAIEALGARVVTVEAARHDRLVARTSHLPHVVAAALCGALGDACEEHDFIGSGLRDTTRIAAGSSEVWREILLTNADQVLAALEEFGAEVDRYRRALSAGDEVELTALLDAARSCRQRMPEP
ncbi:MAG: prephenate dehydrogenase [Armatimonadota bacterium]